MERKFFNLILSAIFIASIASVNQVYAAISLDRTRIVFNGPEKSVSIGIKNQNQQLPFLAQSWIEDEQGHKIQSPLIVLPPIQRLEPGKASQIKIQQLPEISNLPKDRETLYYYNLREIPPRSDKPNTLQIALQTRIKLFYRPEGIAIDTNMASPQTKLTLSRQGNKYVVNNPTPYYITIVDGRPKGGVSPKNFEPLMLAPKSQAPLNVPADALGSHPELYYINDYGGRPMLSFNCSPTSCHLEPIVKK